MLGCVRGIPSCPGPEHSPEQKEGCDRGANHCDLSLKLLLDDIKGGKKSKGLDVVFGQTHPDIADKP